jgi:hypothetical protein
MVCEPACGVANASLHGDDRRAGKRQLTWPATCGATRFAEEWPGVPRLRWTLRDT